MRSSIISKKKDDYEYIDRFIDFLERIINMVKDFFAKIKYAIDNKGQ